MTLFKRYLVEEIALDHVEGLLGRREALRRLGMLGLSAAAGASLLAACGGDDSGAGAASSSSGQGGSDAAGKDSAPPGSQGAVRTQEITFAGPAGRLRAAWAPAAQPAAAVLVIHENKGLTDHIRSVAGRLAGSGFSALAVDLLSAEGGTAALKDPAAATAALAKVPDQRFVADLKAGVGELARRVPGARLGAVGFCFGGGLTWLLLASGENRLAAAAPFYGPLPEGADFSGAKAAVLGIYGEQDQRVNASRDAASAALKAAGLTHEIVTFRGAGHAFFNDTGQRYDAGAAAEAYQRLRDWFSRYLA